MSTESTSIIDRLTAACQTVLKTSQFPSDVDREFFGRVYSTSLEVYVNRLRAIGFYGLDWVLDAGCGFGQWSLALSLLNDSVCAFDIDDFRVRILRELVADVSRSNIYALESALEKLPYANNVFDAVFCYGVILFADFRLALNEFYRVLKPGGKLYFTANGIGWYLYNLFENHKPSKDYSPRRMALETFWSSSAFYLTGQKRPGKQLIIPMGTARVALEQRGFRRIRIEADGAIGSEAGFNACSFFPKSHYALPSVYEVLCER